MIRGNIAGINNLDAKIVKIKDLPRRPCWPAMFGPKKERGEYLAALLFRTFDSSMRRKGEMIGKLGEEEMREKMADKKGLTRGWRNYFGQGVLTLKTETGIREQKGGVRRHEAAVLAELEGESGAGRGARSDRGFGLGMLGTSRLSPGSCPRVPCPRVPVPGFPVCPRVPRVLRSG